MKRIATSLLLTVLIPLALCAQDGRGTILGRVLDPSGAVIPGADVRATNTSTGVAAGVKTNESGNFTMPYLLPGTYTVQSEMGGFKKFVRENVQVRVGDTVEVNLRMEVGDAAETVDVKAETPLLSTAESTLGQVIDERRIVELPTFGGSAVSLVLLAPGTVNGADMRQADRASTNVNSQFSVNGSGQYSNEFTLDGVSNTLANTQGNTDSGRVGFIPPQTAVSEFKVQTASFDASIGHTSGSLINVSIKSGTNQLHGQANWMVRNRIFDAPKIFQNRSGQEVPVYQNNRYGLAAGGPVTLPRVYDGKNKTFWFYAWEEHRHGIPQTFIATVPTDAMRRGDLSGLLALGANYQVYDPATTAVAPNGRFSRQPIPGNIIPASRIDPVAKGILNYWPAANQPGTVEGRNNWYHSQPTATKSWVHLGRVDHAFSQNHRAFVRLHRDSWDSHENQVLNNIARGYFQTRINRGLALDDVYIINPSFLLNLRYGLAHQEWIERRASSGFDLASLGFSQRLLALIPDLKQSALPRVTVSPFEALGNWAAGDGVGTAMSHSVTANFTKLRADHNLRFGAEFRVYLQNRNQNPADISPTLTYSSSYTRGPLDNSAAPTIGGEIAAFLLGIPGGSMDRTASAAERDKYLGLYIQDDWKLTPRLTLNLGLRYEIETPITERYNRSVAQFAFDQASPIEAQAQANYARSVIPELPLSQFRVLGGLTFANVGGNSRNYWRGEKNNFMPRIGLAYQLFPKTVLRAGYGMFYDSLGTLNTLSIQTGFSQSTPIQPTFDSGLSFVATNADPFPTGLLRPSGAAGGLMTNIGQAISAYPAKRLHSYTQRWSFGVQQALPWQFLGEAAYVGSRGSRLNITRQLNNTPAQYLSRSPVRDTQTINYLSASFANPFDGTDPIFGRNTSRASLLRPYPQFGNISMLDPVGYSWYHSLQVRAEKRLSSGFTVQLSYTWSKAMEALEFLNATDPVPYESIGALDRTHRVVVSWIWELPFGRGRHFGTSMPKALDFLAGGWQLNSVVQRQSGPPLGFGDVFTLFTGNPDDIVLPKNERNVDRWFNTAAGFNRNSAQVLASNIRVSPLRFSGVRGDGQARWDFSAIKNFSLHERAKMQFRAECLNAWNHPNLFTPNTSPTSSTFGMITGQDVPRIWQLSLKMVF
ncbi:MAG TPA: TonB-dependent receptor [Bryobacteraceae bacterium]|nr:TonB-dependent receptor [Bryobacteraceae bacterium]